MPPQISEFQFEDPVIHGAYITLQCNASLGDLPIQILWSHSSNQTIGSDSGLRTMKLGPRTSVLMIDSITSQHLGAYTCTAKSAAGSSNYTAALKAVMGIRILAFTYIFAF